MWKTTTAALTALLLAAPGLQAQGGGMHGGHGQESDEDRSGQHGMMGQGMMGQMGQGQMGRHIGMMAMGGPGPAMILRMDDALDLTQEQTSRLEALQEEVASTHRERMQETMSARREAASALEGDAPDFAAYEDALSRAASSMVQAHVTMARTSAEARQLLTEEQRQELHHGMRMMRRMMGGQGMQGMEHGGMEHH